MRICPLLWLQRKRSSHLQLALLPWQSQLRLLQPPRQTMTSTRTYLHSSTRLWQSRMQGPSLLPQRT